MRALGLTEPEEINEDVASSAPTDDEGIDVNDIEAQPEKVGDTEDCTYDSGVQKEILEVGEGVNEPKRNSLATIIYKAYFFDHT